MKSNQEHSKWINLCLSRISMLQPQIGKHLIEKCGRQCPSKKSLLDIAINIDKKNKEFLNSNRRLEQFKAEVSDWNLSYTDDLIKIEFTKCICPLSKSGVDHKFLCNCSLGATKEIFETLLKKPVDVELKQSILRGSKTCIQHIKIDKIKFVPFNF